MARPDKSYLEKQTSRRNPPKKKTLGESSVDSRMAKISFKNYLRQIEEELLDEGDDLYEEELSHEDQIAIAKRALQSVETWLSKNKPDGQDGWAEEVFIDEKSKDVFVTYAIDYNSDKADESVWLKVTDTGEVAEAGESVDTDSLTDLSEDIPDMLP